MPPLFRTHSEEFFHNVNVKLDRVLALLEGSLHTGVTVSSSNPSLPISTVFDDATSAADIQSTATPPQINSDSDSPGLFSSDGRSSKMGTCERAKKRKLNISQPSDSVRRCCNGLFPLNDIIMGLS